MNPYLYCGGDPVNAVDPTGLLTVSDDGDHWAQGMIGLIEVIAGSVVQWTGVCLLAVGVAAFGAGAGAGSAVAPGPGTAAGGGVGACGGVGALITGVGAYAAGSVVMNDGWDRLFVAVGMTGDESVTTLESIQQSASGGDWDDVVATVVVSSLPGFLGSVFSSWWSGTSEAY